MRDYDFWRYSLKMGDVWFVESLKVYLIYIIMKCVSYVV